MAHEPKPSNLPLGICISLIAYIFFVTASSLVWSFKKAFPTIQIIFFQNIVSLICIIPLALRKGPGRLKTDILSIHLLRDVAGVLSYYLYFVAIRYLNLTDATTLNYSAPFFVPIIWWIWTKEKIDLHVWWSIIVGFIGVAVILNPTRQIFQEGFVFGLSAGILSAIAFASLRILNLNKEPMSRTLFYYFLFGTIFSAPFAAIYWVAPSGLQWLKVVGVGLATVTAQMLLTVAYRYGTASFLSPLGYSTVIYAALISWLFFHIPPNTRSIVGTALIVIGGTMTYLLKKKPEKISETFEIPDPKEKPPL
ncbi:MAG: DMT family transporter [Parachlamydiales bacterium]|nr:DMT family transporter [Parachlamydiales bacterium]